METCTQHYATFWSAELSSRRTAKICPKHTCNQPQVNMQNMCTHLVCGFHAVSPVQNTHTPRDAITTRRQNTTKSKALTELHLCCLQGGLSWKWTRPEQLLAAVKKPPSEDRKRLQALTALIGSIMKLHGTYLMVTTGDILFVRTEMLHMTPGRSYRVWLAELWFNYSLKCIIKMCHAPVVEFHQ